MTSPSIFVRREYISYFSAVVNWEGVRKLLRIPLELDFSVLVPLLTFMGDFPSPTGYILTYFGFCIQG